MIVPAVTENWYRQSLQSNTGRFLSSLMLIEPHFGHCTPSGQRRSSSNSRHFASVPKSSIMSSRLTVMPGSRKKKRRLPKNIATNNDHEVAERLFGKRAKRELDRIAGVSPKPIS